MKKKYIYQKFVFRRLSIVGVSLPIKFPNPILLFLPINLFCNLVKVLMILIINEINSLNNDSFIMSLWCKMTPASSLKIQGVCNMIKNC